MKNILPLGDALVDPNALHSTLTTEPIKPGCAKISSLFELLRKVGASHLGSLSFADTSGATAWGFELLNCEMLNFLGLIPSNDGRTFPVSNQFGGLSYKAFIELRQPLVSLVNINSAKHTE